MRIRDACAIGAALVVFGVSGQSQAVLPSPQPAAATAHHQARGPAHQTSAGTVMLDWGDPESTPEAWKGNYVVLQPWEYPRIAGLKAKNPGIKIFMYKDVSATVKASCRDACTRDNAILPSGVGYHWALRHHPQWFLRDSHGRKLQWSDWPGLYPMNVANRAYQDRWASSVVRELKAHDWDGVLMDDVLTRLSHTVYGDRVSTRIPDDAAMYRASERFLASVGPRVERAGYTPIANIAFQWNDWRSVLHDWSRYVSGWENEYFVKWGLSDDSGRFTGDDWRWKMQLSAWCARNRVPLLAVTYSTSDDVATQIYHRATWLLTWNGRTGASVFVPDADFTDHWMRRPTLDIGRPVAHRYRVGGDVYRRNYSRGVVLVNPTRHVREVDLGRSYRALNGRVLHSIRLEPASGRILRVR